MVTVTVQLGACVLTPSPLRVFYMTQIWLKSKMRSTSHFPKEFRNTLARGRSAKKLKRTQKSDF